MRKMTAKQARNTNGGYTIWECRRCRIRIGTGIFWWKFGKYGYAIKPLRCPHCLCNASWKKVK